MTASAAAGSDVQAGVTSLQGLRSQRSGCGNFSTLRFEPLAASEKEVRDIVALWKSEAEPAAQLVGAAASEQGLETQAPHHAILHLATHGFFLGRRCASALGGTRGLGGVVVGPTFQGSDPGRLPPPAFGENPLLLSGLALAGANHRTVAGPDEEDGILTAQEIASLDLSGVSWAVLSACDTGVGEIRVGEGVLGLRRAFQVAGARTVIMSLWPVEDEATHTWMTALYEARLKKHLGTAEAVRHASLTVLNERRAAGRSTHPFYWAGFVAAGDWR